MLKNKINKKYLLIKLCFIFILLLNLIKFSVYAQKEDLRFDHITIDDGLTQSTVTSIIQDKYGFIWLATEDGLNKYDGYNVIPYKNDPDDSTSIPNNIITSLCRDKDDNIWIGTEGGLCMYNYEKDNFINVTPQYKNKSLLNNLLIVFIYPDPVEGIWFSLNLMGVVYYNYKTGEYTHYAYNENDTTSINHNLIFTIEKDTKNNLWFATGNGFCKYIPEKNNFKRYFYKKDHTSNSFSTLVIDIKSDTSNTLYFTRNNQLYSFNQKNEKIKLLNTTYQNKKTCLLYYLFVDKNNQLWLSSTCGLHKYNVEKPEKSFIYKHSATNPKSLSYNVLSRFLEDRNGNLWIGSYGGGANFINRHPLAFNHIFQESDDVNQDFNDVFSIYKDKKNNLWMGTKGPLKKYNLITKKFVNYPVIDINGMTLPPQYINSVFKDSQDIFWIGTNEGIYKFKEKKEVFTFYSHPKNKSSLRNQVWNITEDSKENVWFSTRIGLGKYLRDKDSIIYYSADTCIFKSLPNFDVRHTLEDSNGNLWIGAYGGLYRFDYDNDSIVAELANTDPDNPIKNNIIFRIHESKYSKEKIWMATLNGLISYNTRNKKIKRYLEKDGLCNSVVFSIQEDNHHNLWLSTNNGISKFNPQNESFENYFKHDGLQSNVFRIGSSFKDKKGIIYFGGIDGVNCFNPDSIKEKGIIPEIYITEFYLYDKKVPINKRIEKRVILKKHISLTSKIELSYNQNIISFDFAAINFKDIKKNKYAYKLEGLNKDWINIGIKNHISFNGIPPGDYQLKIRCSYTDDFSNSKEKTLDIVILPPFWKTLWFRITFMSLIVISLTIWIRIKMRSIQTQNKILEKRVKKRTEELYEVNAKLEEKQTDLEAQQEEIMAQRDSIEEQNKQLEKLSIVASKTDNAIAIMNANGNIEWINDAHIKMYGYTLEEFKKEKGVNILDVSSNKNIKNIIEHCIQNKETVTYESKVISKSGKSIWTHATITPIVDLKGTIFKLVSIESDIVKLKEYEHEILQKNEELATQHESIEQQNKELEEHKKHLDKLVKARTAELEKAKLKAEESDRLKSAFLANMSHEIRTPMNAIIGFSNLLNNIELDDKEKEELISHIEHNSNTLLHLIDDIIDISKIEASQLEIHKKECKVNILLKELMETYTDKKRTFFKENLDLRLKASIKEEGFSIFTDPIRLQQIFINLLDNAFKFTEEGFIEFGYTLDKNNDEIVFYVKDTGIGLSKSQQKTVFGRFTKIENDKKKLYRGAGLGLAISKNITELLGGEIWIDSDPGKGATFYFSLPLEIILKEDSPSQNIKKQGNFDWKNKTILIAEDEDSNYNLLQILLNRTNATLIRAKDGKEALEIFKNKADIDLILMDIKMPEIDGLEATREIRKNNKSIPIIAQTAFAMANDEKISLQAGCTDYIAKPIKRQKLFEILSKFLG